jgi:hypothetical protein
MRALIRPLRRRVRPGSRALRACRPLPRASPAARRGEVVPPTTRPGRADLLAISLLVPGDAGIGVLDGNCFQPLALTPRAPRQDRFAPATPVFMNTLLLTRSPSHRTDHLFERESEFAGRRRLRLGGAPSWWPRFSREERRRRLQPHTSRLTDSVRGNRHIGRATALDSSQVQSTEEALLTLLVARSSIPAATSRSRAIPRTE